MESENGIFASKEAAAGRNGRSINPPMEHREKVLWFIQRITKLSNERLATARCIKDARAAAKNDGYAADELALTKKLRKMSPERRDQYRDKLERSLARFGLTVELREENPPPDKLLEEHLQKLRIFEADRSEYSLEITETYKSAKDNGLDVKALKQIIGLAYMSEEDRVQYFNDLDNLGSIANYW